MSKECPAFAICQYHPLCFRRYLPRLWLSGFERIWGQHVAPLVTSSREAAGIQLGEGRWRSHPWFHHLSSSKGNVSRTFTLAELFQPTLPLLDPFFAPVFRPGRLSPGPRLPDRRQPRRVDGVGGAGAVRQGC